jgi:hypothetical protein
MEEAVIARALITATAFLLAVGTFWDDALGAGHFLNPFGILLLLLTGFIWFA